MTQNNADHPHILRSTTGSSIVWRPVISIALLVGYHLFFSRLSFTDLLFWIPLIGSMTLISTFESAIEISSDTIKMTNFWSGTLKITAPKTIAFKDITEISVRNQQVYTIYGKADQRITFYSGYFRNEAQILNRLEQYVAFKQV